ncbi:MAG TPA: hypothetical protein VNJ52_00370 [Patescibacteria group bacterium]|nr:hypothetical protein [Patescibacteria group bacterium]
MPDKGYIPEWLRKIKQSDDTARAQEFAAKIAEEKAEQAIRAEGPAFWRRLIRELQAAPHAMSELGMDEVVGICQALNISKAEESYRFGVRSIGVIPKFTHVDLVYATGDHQIRCNPLNEPSYKLLIRPGKDGRIGALRPDTASPYVMNEFEVAEEILRSMLREVRSPLSECSLI